MFIVKYYDKAIEENQEFEFSNFGHAKETYFILKDQSDIEYLHILEYKQGEYFLVTI